ncbi:hypothetical protein VPH35_009308 [Triticum aestivum]
MQSPTAAAGPRGVDQAGCSGGSRWWAAAASAVRGGRTAAVATGPATGKTRMALPAEVSERGAVAGVAAGARNRPGTRAGRRGGGARRGGCLGGAAAVGVGLLDDAGGAGA